MLFAVDHRIDVVGGELEAVAVGDGVGGAGFDAIAAENAARIIDVVDRGVAIAGGDALIGRVLGGFDVNAARGACGGAQKTAYTFFEAIFIAMQHVNAAIARLKMNRLFGIIFGDGLEE